TPLEDGVVPPAALGKACAATFIIKLDADKLVEVDHIVLKAPLRSCHVHAPQLSGGKSDQFHGAAPIALQILAPIEQGAHVIKAQRFGVYDLKANILHGLGNRARARQLTIGEDIPVNKRTLGGLVIVRVGNAVIEHDAAFVQLVMHKVKEVLVVIHTDVL